MSHIADLHNNGRCGVHQHIEQARHAYAQQIDKEFRAADQANIRRRLQQMGVRCPLCRAPAVAYKCQACGHFPVILPELLPPLRETAASLPQSKHASPSPTSLSQQASSQRRRQLEDRLASLELLVRDEKEQQHTVLDQIAAVKELLMKRKELQSPSNNNK